MRAAPRSEAGLAVASGRRVAAEPRGSVGGVLVAGVLAPVLGSDLGA